MEWLPLIVAALIIGIAKTSFGGLGSVAVALMALVMPTKESTAAALLLLITGDIVAVLRYRSNADWGMLRSLLPSVLPGLLLGAVFIRVVNDLMLRRSIGAILLIAGADSAMYWVFAGMLGAIIAAVMNAWILLVEILR